MLFWATRSRELHLGADALQQGPEALHGGVLPDVLHEAMPVEVDHPQGSPWQALAHPPHPLGKVLAQQELIPPLCKVRSSEVIGLPRSDKFNGMPQSNVIHQIRNILLD